MPASFGRATKRPVRKAAKKPAGRTTTKSAPQKRAANKAVRQTKKKTAKQAVEKKEKKAVVKSAKKVARKTAKKAVRESVKKPSSKMVRKPSARTAKKVTRTSAKKTKRGTAAKRSANGRSRSRQAEEFVAHAPSTATLRASSTRKSSTRKSRSQARPSAASTRNRRRVERAAIPRRRRRSKALPVTELGERYAAYLTLAFVGLTLFGLVMVLSASSVPSLHQLEASPFYQFRKQAMWAAIGGVAFIVMSRLDYRRLRPLATAALGLSLVLLMALLIPGLGRNVNGSTRWLALGPVTVQPAELAKLALIVFIADLLTKRERRMDRPELTVRPVMLTVFGTSVLLLLQPKLGTPIILGAVALLMLFVAGAQVRSMLLWTALSVGSVLGIAFSTGYQSQRIDGWLDPWADPQGAGAQLIQSWVGIASGGWFGQGLGASRAKWGFLPEAQTDFIFAVVAEETGLVGASALIGAFVLIGWIGIRVALAAPDRFGMLLAAGITGWLLIQAFLNIGMVVGMLPITGEALPFVSAGGSSLMTALAAAGLLVGIARRARNDS